MDKKILFIGNSFTYFNDMPKAIFEKICMHKNIPVSVESITSGGYKLIQFTDPVDKHGKMVLSRLSENVYDIVIIQEQSRNPILNYEEFFEGAYKLYSLAKEKGADVYLYQTWGYKEGHTLLHLCGKDTSDMALKLKAAYEKAGKELNCKLAPVGTAFEIINQSNKINLYNDDLFHPSLFGSVLAAWTIFSTIFQISPSEVDYDCQLDAEISHEIKNAAYNAVFSK